MHSRRKNQEKITENCHNQTCHVIQLSWSLGTVEGCYRFPTMCLTLSSTCEATMIVARSVVWRIARRIYELPFVQSQKCYGLDSWEWVLGVLIYWMGLVQFNLWYTELAIDRNNKQISLALRTDLVFHGGRITKLGANFWLQMHKARCMAKAICCLKFYMF